MSDTLSLICTFYSILYISGDKCIKVSLLEVRVEDTAPAILEKGIQRYVSVSMVTDRKRERERE